MSTTTKREIPTAPGDKPEVKRTASSVFRMLQEVRERMTGKAGAPSEQSSEPEKKERPESPVEALKKARATTGRILVPAGLKKETA